MTAYERRRLIEDIADRVVEKLTAIGVKDETMTADEAAAFLGISRSTLYNKIAEIPHTKTGRKLLFSRRSLSEYIHR